MKKANLPVEKASEPSEEARQPLSDSDDRVENSPMAPTKKKALQNIKFAESEPNDSQTSSNYKEVLSQPPGGVTHRQRLLWLQKRRGVGLWAQCDDCDKWRFLPDVLERHELPSKWFCRMNQDKSMANCSVPEAPLRLRDEEDLIHNEYTAGSLVWARFSGWPWWPAMVDDDPDTEQYYWLDGFSDIPTFYNVVFFDEPEVTRAWISPKNLRPYTSHQKTFSHVLKNRKYKKRLTKAVAQADDATKIILTKRLARYSFIAKYKGPVSTPKKINKNVLKRIQGKLQKKFNIEIPVDCSSESEEENEVSDDVIEKKKKKNANTGETPKNKRQKKQVAVKYPSSVADAKTPLEKKASVDQIDSEKQNDVSAYLREVYRKENIILVGTPKTKRYRKRFVPGKLNTVAETASCERATTDISNPNSSNQNTMVEHEAMIIEKARKQLSKYMEELPNNNKPKKLGKIIEDTINQLDESPNDISQATSYETNNQSTGIFKEPNSMAAQPGSRNDTLFIDNSKDHSTASQDKATVSMVVPNSQTQSEMYTNTDDDPDFDIRRAPSPSSDDFEF